MMNYRLADHENTPLAYTGGKGRIVQHLAWLRPWNFEEYREPFAGGAAMLFYLRKIAPCKRYWINDIDPRVVAFHRTLRDDADRLVDRLLDIHADHGLGTPALFAQWKNWLRSSDPLDLAVTVFLEGRITRGRSDRAGFAWKIIEKGKGLTRSKIIRLRGFADLLQAVTITNSDYRDVMDADGKRVFIFADPPYEDVGADCYDHGAFNLAEFADAIDRCQHACLWTLNDSAHVRAAFAHRHLIAHQVWYSCHRNERRDEIIGVNYTMPLFETHGRSIGTLISPSTDLENSSACHAIEDAA